MIRTEQLLEPGADLLGKLVHARLALFREPLLHLPELSKPRLDVLSLAHAHYRASERVVPQRRRTRARASGGQGVVTFLRGLAIAGFFASCGGGASASRASRSARSRAVLASTAACLAL